MIDLFFFVSAGVFNLELDVAFLRGGFAGLSPEVDTLFSLCSEDFPAGGSWVFALEACSLLALVPSTSWGVMRRRFFLVALVLLEESPKRALLGLLILQSELLQYV